MRRFLLAGLVLLGLAGAPAVAQLAKGPVTLLYAARDEARNNAVALRDWLQKG